MRMIGWCLCDASRRIKFAREKSLVSRNFSSEFLFQNSVLLCSSRGAVEWIKSPIAILSQPIFLTNIWAVLLEKKNVKGEAHEVQVW